MDIHFDLIKFGALLGDFHRITGLRVGVYDRRLQEMLACPQAHSAYCQAIRADAAALARCGACDAQAFERAQREGSVYVYRCHAGLMEAVAPIKGQDQAIIGYLMIGQAWSEADGPGHDGMAQAPQTARMDTKTMHACARILQSCATSVWLDGFVRAAYEDLPGRLSRYIDAGLSSRLSIAGACAALGVGKTTLCACAQRHFGVTFGTLVRGRRMQAAMALLERTDAPISAIAEQVGIGDCNYFSRTFRQEVGVTPSAWRKRRAAGARESVPSIGKSK